MSQFNYIVQVWYGNESWQNFFIRSRATIDEIANPVAVFKITWKQ